MAEHKRSSKRQRLRLLFRVPHKAHDAADAGSRSPGDSAPRVEPEIDPTLAFINPSTVDETTLDTEGFFDPGEDPFEKISVCLRESSFPTSLACFLLVELVGEKDNGEEKFCTKLLDLEWQKSIPEFYSVADQFAKSKYDKENSKASYLVSVGYTIHQQQSPLCAVSSNRLVDTRERQQAEPNLSARSQGYHYDVHSTNTLTNTKNWEAAWNDIFPPSVAKALLDADHAVYIIEVTFRYQVYSKHDPRSCDGGEECFQQVIKALRSQSATSYRRDTSFIPTRFFGIYFTQDVVSHLLSRYNNGKSEWDLPIIEDEARAQFIQHISNFGTRLLATCIYAKIGVRRLFELYEAGVEDVSLPLIKDGQRPLPQGYFMIPLDWPENERDLFYDQQFRFCAHQFQGKQDDQKVLRIRNRVIMPFLEKEQLPESSQGSYADVSFVKIHEQHHEFSNDRSQLFAVKSFKRQDGENFRRERAICQKLAQYPHDHLTAYLTVWEDSEARTFNILFPKAERDLDSYLRGVPSPENMTQKLPWFINQMFGLAEGLASIHRLGPSRKVESDSHPNATRGRQEIVCHHDLKPSNILVFRDRQGLEMMKISDFGLARIKERKSRNNEDPASPRTRARDGTREYMAPEKRLIRDSSRPSDVWSLGCIFLVMVLWFFGDKENLAQFRATRALQPTREGEEKELKSFPWHEFWHLKAPTSSDLQEAATMKEDDPKRLAAILQRVALKTAVQKKFTWLKLEADASENGVLQDLVDLISLDMMTPDPIARKCAPFVCSELKNFSHRVERGFDDPGNHLSKIFSTDLSTLAASTDIEGVLDNFENDQGSPASPPMNDGTTPAQILRSAGGQFSEE